MAAQSVVAVVAVAVEVQEQGSQGRKCYSVAPAVAWVVGLGHRVMPQQGNGRVFVAQVVVAAADTSASKMRQHGQIRVVFSSQNFLMDGGEIALN